MHVMFMCPMSKAMKRDIQLVLFEVYHELNAAPEIAAQSNDKNHL